MNFLLAVLGLLTKWKKNWLLYKKYLLFFSIDCTRFVIFPLLMERISTINLAIFLSLKRLNQFQTICIGNYQSNKREMKSKTLAQSKTWKAKYQKVNAATLSLLKILINRSPSNLYSIIPQLRSIIQICSTLRKTPLNTKIVTFQKNVFLAVLCEWNKLDINIHCSISFLTFK